MDRRHIAALGIAIATASSAALAQPPDFSPMRPKSLEAPQATVESNGSEEDAQLLRREPARDVPSVSTYPAPVTEVAPVDAAPYEPYVAREPVSEPIAPPPPTTTEATIGRGLFNRNGVNDFGA